MYWKSDESTELNLSLFSIKEREWKSSKLNLIQSWELTNNKVNIYQNEGEKMKVEEIKEVSEKDTSTTSNQKEDQSKWIINQNTHRLE